ncbi:hypothetical protein CT0861_08412 [Colletotrichum tofieldiae]|uniref:Uncharacterized protein n=1 Tax=Colletotrichum tofieldiae TaxID=708197 RepID=A0A166UUQ3_9PEZI|nr:hypothetical protein CT0861_08412 [Colletotrichum tofieldiae]
MHNTNVRMINPDHSFTFKNLASKSFDLIHHSVPTAPDVRMVKELPDSTVLAKDGEAIMSWTKGCYFGKSGRDDVMLCWQEMEALQSFCIGIESPERGFFKPIKSHYKIKYNDGKTEKDWFFPSENPGDSYTFPSTMDVDIVVKSHAVTDQLELEITIRDKGPSDLKQISMLANF